MDRNRIAHVVAPVLLLGLLFFSCRKKEEERPPAPPASPVSPDVRVVATVNKDPITLAEFLDRFSRAGIRPERDAEFEVKREFLNRLIERKMMLREAQRKRIMVGLHEINKRVEAISAEHGKSVSEIVASLGGDFEKWKSDIWEDLMIERLINREIGRKTAVSAAEIRRYYQANPQEFERPEQVRVRQIVVATEDEARRIEARLQVGEDFAALARERSTAPEAEAGGELGYFAMGDMPAEFNVVFGLPKGGTSGVVKSPYGFHLFRREDTRRAGKISQEEASKDIETKLHREKEDTRYKQWLRELRSRTKFEVNYQVLQPQSP